MSVSTYKLVIEAIHKKWYDGTPFAIREVQSTSGCSTSSVARVMKNLVKLKMVVHSKKGFMGRHYRTDIRWPAKAKMAIQHYEWARILKI